MTTALRLVTVRADAGEIQTGAYCNPAHAQASVGGKGRHTLLSGHPASTHQSAIFDAIADPRSGSRMVIAVAGSGKTTTFKNALRHVPPGAHVQGVAFGKDAAAALKGALDEIIAADGPERYRNVRMGTIHSVCYAAILRSLGLRAEGLKPNKNKLREILKARLTPDDHEVYASFVASLVSKAKGDGVGVLVPDTEDRWYDLVDHYGLYLDSEDATVERGIEIARKVLVYSTSYKVTKERRSIDFDDMPYLVLLWRLRLWRNDLVLLDECFVPDTPILVGLNGAQRMIKDLYDEDYRGPIVTWSQELGSHLSRVSAVKRVAVGKPMVRVRTRQIGYAKNGARLGSLTEHVRFKTRTVVCTADHRVWTDKGWVAAGDLASGMTVKHETVAPVSRSYQSRYAHTASGRLALREKGDHSRFGGSPHPPRGQRMSGGNGRVSLHENLLLERLGDGWIYNHVIPTGISRTKLNGKIQHSERLPTHYKVDFVNLDRRIAVELDGGSHDDPYRAEQDARKDAWLARHGWRVVRLKNSDVKILTDEELCSRLGACPVDAIVVSVEPWTNRKHDYVYDLTVEGTHCYFAHGLLVHNCQDTNATGRAIVRLLLKPGGRLFAAGDPFQSIFGFRGASVDATDLIRREFRATDLPLTISWRCSRSVVAEARRWVDHIESAPGAPEGSVEWLPEEDGLKQIAATDAVLCRQTAPLVTLAYNLIAVGRGCRVLGKEIGEGLVALVRAQRAKGVDRLVAKLEAWRDREAASFMAKGDETAAEAVTDRVECVMVVVRALPETERTVPALERRILALFEDRLGAELLTLATCHKAKGLEWETVGILRPDLMPSRAARQEWEHQQEANLQYVAATRAKQRLIYLEREDV